MRTHPSAVLVLMVAAMLALSSFAAAQESPLYQGKLFDGHGHPISWFDPPLTVPAIASMMREVGTMGVFLNTMNMHSGGAEEGARIARSQYPNIVFPFL